MLHKNLDINEKGNLTLAGVDTIDMAHKYGTPLYLMDENRIRENCRTYINAMRKSFKSGSMPYYASKALSCKEIYRIVASEGAGADVVSMGELYTALEASFPPEKLCLHGNAKISRELEFAIDCGIGCIVADSKEDLIQISRIAGKKGISQRIQLRLAPGIDPHTFEKINTGRIDSKFGAAIENGQALEMAEIALGMDNLVLEGFHCHIGSQIFEIQPFCDAADIMLSFMQEVREKLGFTASVLNLGGGFGVRYVESDPEVSYERNIELVSKHIKAKCAEYSFPDPIVYMEPGRGIVGDAGITLYTVQSVKCIPEYKNYVAIDGGMTDNPRYALYEAPHSAIVASKAGEKADFTATLAGRCCESGDIIEENVKIKEPVAGDYVAVLTTGAYNYSMASNYNRVGRPPIVMIRDKEDRVIVRRETLKDLVMYDI